MSAVGDTPGGVSATDDTGGVSAVDDTSVQKLGDTGVQKLGDTPIYKERARLHVGHVDKKEKEEDVRASVPATDGAADLFTTARRAAAQAAGERAADEIASGQRLPFTSDVIRELTSLDVEVEALVERYRKRTRGRRIDDPSAYLLRMGRDQVAKTHGISVDALVKMASRNLAERGQAIILTAANFTGPSAEAVTRARRFSNPHVDAALAMLEGRKFPTLFAADKAFELALMNARFAPPPRPSAAKPQLDAGEAGVT